MAGTSEPVRASPIAVIIVNYNADGLILDSLPALLDELSGRDGQVIIVDNASPQGDGARLEEALAKAEFAERVTLVRSAVNGGFAAGNNIALDHLRGQDRQPDAVLLLNPDAALRPGAIAAMEAVLRDHPSAGFVGPRVENPDGSSWMGAFNFPSAGSEILGRIGIGRIARHFSNVLQDAAQPVRAGWITGTAALIRWQVVEDIGNMDDGYFLYYEETDYMRTALNAGWESWHAPQALVGHVAGASTGIVNGAVRQGRVPSYWFDSWVRYFVKHHGPLQARLIGIGRLVAMMNSAALGRLRGKPVHRPERYYRDWLQQIVLRRMSPPPDRRSDVAG